MKILFVCSANICRSALVEVILKKKLHERGLNEVLVDSAGIHNYACHKLYAVGEESSEKDHGDISLVSIYLSPIHCLSGG